VPSTLDLSTLTAIRSSPGPGEERERVDDSLAALTDFADGLESAQAMWIAGPSGCGVIFPDGDVTRSP
jgi:hypothetical protein